jgi:probable addiction module antidote protein
MSKTKPQSKLVPFDAARYLTDDAAVAEYMTAVLETEDPDLLLLALADVARARGMAQVAKEAGLGRESLYKALAPGAKPRFDTVLKVARALGVRLTALPVWQSGVKPNPSIRRTGRRRSATSSSVLARR